MNKLIEFLGYGDLPFPYDDAEFLAEFTNKFEALCPAIESDVRVQRLFLTQLVTGEWYELFPDELSCPQSLHLWGSSGDPAYALFAFEEFDASGGRITPAFQKILSIATGQFLANKKPPRSASKKVIKQRLEQSDAMYRMMALVILLNDSVEEAAQKAANHSRGKDPDFNRGIGSKTLENIFYRNKEVFELMKEHFASIPREYLETQLEQLAQLNSAIPPQK